jgi:hypothetical protein
MANWAGTRKAYSAKSVAESPLRQMALSISFLSPIFSGPVVFLMDGADAQSIKMVPSFQVDSFWPKTLPNNWLVGAVAGVAADAQHHIWIVHRPSNFASIICAKPRPLSAQPRGGFP